MAWRIRRDVHLGEAESRADLRLREVLGEAQVQDRAFTVAEHTHQALDPGGLVAQVISGVLDADAVDQFVARLGVVAGPVERDW